MLPFLGFDLLFPNDFHCVVLPLMDNVCSRFAVLQPEIKTPKVVVLIHLCENGPRLVAVRSLDPTAVAEWFIPRWIPESFHLDESVAFDFQAAVELGVADRFGFSV
jgi:hypothetical protein